MLGQLCLEYMRAGSWKAQGCRDLEIEKCWLIVIRVEGQQVKEHSNNRSKRQPHRFVSYMHNQVYLNIYITAITSRRQLYLCSIWLPSGLLYLSFLCVGYSIHQSAGGSSSSRQLIRTTSKEPQPSRPALSTSSSTTTTINQPS